MKIPLYKPYLSNNEVSAVSRVFKSRKLSRGVEIELFEKEFASYVGKKHAIAVNSGTSGLHILVRTLGWKKGDEVITTPFSYIASANALLFEGITPVFVDIDPQTLNINANKIEEKITSKTKGMILVHILGLPVNYQKIKQLKDKYNLQVIEDACEAIGKPDDDFIVTKLGEAIVYGFNENKQLTTGGEGGMIVTDDSTIAQRCMAMRDQGRSLKKDWVRHVILGFNFRMTEIQAALGISQFSRGDKFISLRRKIAEYYNKQLAGCDVEFPFIKNGKTHIYDRYLIRVKSASRLISELQKRGVEAKRSVYKPLHWYVGLDKRLFPNMEEVYRRAVTLPIFPELSMNKARYVIKQVKEIL